MMTTTTHQHVNTCYNPHMNHQHIHLMRDPEESDVHFISVNLQKTKQKHETISFLLYNIVTRLHINTIWTFPVWLTWSECVNDVIIIRRVCVQVICYTGVKVISPAAGCGWTVFNFCWILAKGTTINWIQMRTEVGQWSGRPAARRRKETSYFYLYSFTFT